MIYQNIKELKAAISKYISTYKFSYERTDVNNDLFAPKPDTFEIVALDKDSDEKMLVPAEPYYSYLFRGQNEEHIPCVPSLYRGKPSEVEIFIERLRLVEFSLLMDTHPVVDIFFTYNNFVVDHKGLAQHYGIKTEVLDFTSDLDVAIFFAICPYDKSSDCYTYIDDEHQDHEAIIYIISPIRYNQNPMRTLWIKIRPIGLQPLMRPGMQRGFGMHLSQGESFFGYIYKFKYTSADSKFYYDKYEQGQKLWTKDDVIDKANSIINKQEFSYRIFNETWRRYQPNLYSKTQMKNKLAEAGIFLSSKCREEQFTEEEKESIIDEWYNGKDKILTSNIVSRKWYDGKIVLADNVEAFKRLSNIPISQNDPNLHLYRNTKMIALEEHLRVFARTQYFSGGKLVDYNKKISSVR
ncbi:MAG: FRG domain-containing protein [Rikenellaceae bacterium]